MRILVTGGAGYVGSELVPALLRRGHRVTVYDWCLFGRDVLASSPNLSIIKADIRDRKMLSVALVGMDAVIHLACISNDPSFELDPALGRSVNFDCLSDIVELSKEAGVKRFIYASSSSVYGVKTEPRVTEDLSLEPLTDYSMYKAMGEEIVRKADSPTFTTTILRPATVCGYAPRLRLDLVVNLFTAQAFHLRKLVILGGDQLRPNLHIEDMVRAYLLVLDANPTSVAGQTFNVGAENLSVRTIAERVQQALGGPIDVTVEASNDKRSYAVDSNAIALHLGFVPRRNVIDAAHGLLAAFKAGLVPNAMTDPRYYNVRMLQSCRIS